jgi:hypothetical protein
MPNKNFVEYTKNVSFAVVGILPHLIFLYEIILMIAPINGTPLSNTFNMNFTYCLYNDRVKSYDPIALWSRKNYLPIAQSVETVRTQKYAKLIPIVRFKME